MAADGDKAHEAEAPRPPPDDVAAAERVLDWVRLNAGACRASSELRAVRKSLEDAVGALDRERFGGKTRAQAVAERYFERLRRRRADVAAKLEERSQLRKRRIAELSELERQLAVHPRAELAQDGRSMLLTSTAAKRRRVAAVEGPAAPASSSAPSPAAAASDDARPPPSRQQSGVAAETASWATELEARAEKLMRETSALPVSIRCYVCDDAFVRVHHFYNNLCPSCAEVNWAKRQQTADLRGRVALLTGCRTNIGLQIGLKLLRAGATLIGTTRFPANCAMRYLQEPDAAAWRDRLHIFGLDLRDLRGVLAFCRRVASVTPAIDILINNAAQTVRRPTLFYRDLVRVELAPRASLPPEALALLCDEDEGGARGAHGTELPRFLRMTSGKEEEEEEEEPTEEIEADARRQPANAASSFAPPQAAAAASSSSAAQPRPPSPEPFDSAVVDARDPLHAHLASLSALVANAGADARAPLPSALLSLLPVAREDAAATAREFPEGAVDPEGKQLDLRVANSWSRRLHEVEPAELVETFSINAMAPFLLCSALKPLLEASPFARRFIINVSAMEGCFARSFKSVTHPHTNMAKAALNMMTRTAAADYAASSIFMNSVDTGWINDERPLHKRLESRGGSLFTPPIDDVDAAARVLDPIFACLNGGAAVFGQFLKDYAVAPW